MLPEKGLLRKKQTKQMALGCGSFLLSLWYSMHIAGLAGI